MIKSLHPNWLIIQDTPFEEYYKEVSSHLETVSSKVDYSLERFTIYRINLWNVNDFKGKTIRASNLTRRIKDKENLDIQIRDTSPSNASPLGVNSNISFHTSAVQLDKVR